MTRRIPEFDSECAEAAFWDTHDITEFVSGLAEDRQTVFVRPEAGVIEISKEVWQELAGIARRRRTTPARLLQRWLAEESKRDRGTRRRKRTTPS